MKTFVRNSLVLSVALALAIPLVPLGVFTTAVIAILQGSARKALVYLSQMVLSVALSIDLLGNVVCKDLFNHALIKADSHPFGDNRETISSVLGKNKATGRLTDLGRCLAGLLDWLQPDHVENAALPTNP